MTRAELLGIAIHIAEEQVDDAVKVCGEALRDARDAVERFAMLGGSADRAAAVVERIEALRRELNLQVDVLGELQLDVRKIRSDAPPDANIDVLVALLQGLQGAQRDTASAGDQASEATDETLANLAGARDADSIATLLDEVEESLGTAGQTLQRSEDEATAQQGAYKRGDDAPQLSDLYVDSLIDRARWLPQTRSTALTRLLASMTNAKIVRRIEAAIAAQEAGRLRGMSDWFDFNAGKAEVELAKSTQELADGLDLAREHPSLHVRVGCEKHAPRGTDGLLLPEFDLALETNQGTVTGSTEVTTVDRLFEQPSHLTRAIDHAAKKVEDRQIAAHPLTGRLEARIHVTLKIGRDETTGGSTARKRNGDIVQRRPDGRLIRRWNLYDKIADHIPSAGRHELLDRITLVDQYQHKISFVREGLIWRRVIE